MSLQADDNEVVATAVPVTASDDNVRNISSPRKIVHRSVSQTKHIQDEEGKCSKEEQERKELLMMKEPAFAFLGFASFMMLIQADHDCDRATLIAKVTEHSQSRWQSWLASWCFFPAFDLAEHFKFAEEYNSGMVTSNRSWLLDCGFGLVSVQVLTFTPHDKVGFRRCLETIGTGWLMTWAGVFTTTALLYPEFLPAWRGLQERFPFLKNWESRTDIPLNTFLDS